MTPYEALLGSQPNISNIRILGSLVYRRLPKNKKESKISPIADKGILIGFKSINYLVYIPETDSIKVIRDISILEDKEYPDNSTSNKNFEIEENEEKEEKENNSSILDNTPRRDIIIEVSKVINREDYITIDSEN